MEQERRALKSCWRKLVSSVRSLAGLGEIAVPLERFVAAWKPRESKRERAKRSGIARPLVGCSTTQPTKVKPPSAKPRLSRFVPVCELNEGVACNPNVRTPIMMFLMSNGCVFRFLLSLMLLCLMRCRNSCKKTGNEHESRNEELAISCRA